MNRNPMPPARRPKTTVEERIKKGFRQAREFGAMYTSIADPYPPWAPALLVEERPRFWGLPKLRRVG